MKFPSPSKSKKHPIEVHATPPLPHHPNKHGKIKPKVIKVRVGSATAFQVNPPSELTNIAWLTPASPAGPTPLTHVDSNAIKHDPRKFPNGQFANAHHHVQVSSECQHEFDRTTYPPSKAPRNVPVEKKPSTPISSSVNQFLEIQMSSFEDGKLHYFWR